MGIGHGDSTSDGLDDGIVGADVDGVALVTLVICVFAERAPQGI